jgi:hypothetical protein
MKMLYTVVILLVAATSNHGGQIGSNDNLQAIQAAEQGKERILTETNFPNLVVLVERLKGESDQALRKSTLNALLRATTSTKPLSLEAYGNLVIPSRVKAGKMREVPGGRTIKQDIFTQRGRAAWALEEALGCELPALAVESTESESRECEFEAFRKVKESSISSDKLIDVSTLSAEKRLALATSTNALDVNLARLALSDDAQARLALASNVRTPVFILVRLRDCDPDPKIRAQATENLIAARSYHN